MWWMHMIHGGHMQGALSKEAADVVRMAATLGFDGVALNFTGMSSHITHHHDESLTRGRSGCEQDRSEGRVPHHTHRTHYTHCRCLAGRCHAGGVWRPAVAPDRPPSTASVHTHHHR